MNLTDKRQNNTNDILKNRFVRRVFSDTAKDIDQAQTRFMSSRGFETSNWYSGRSFNVSDNALDLQVLKKHRFVDMKTIQTDKGKKKKKNHPIYNKIIWGHYNNVIRELSFGFTEAAKEELRKLED